MNGFSFFFFWAPTRPKKKKRKRFLSPPKSFQYPSNHLFPTLGFPTHRPTQWKLLFNCKFSCGRWRRCFIYFSSSSTFVAPCHALSPHPHKQTNTHTRARRCNNLIKHKSTRDCLHSVVVTCGTSKIFFLAGHSSNPENPCALLGGQRPTEERRGKEEEEQEEKRREMEATCTPLPPPPLPQPRLYPHESLPL